MTTAKVRVPDLAAMKQQRRPITMVTAYDYLFSQLFDLAGIDLLLVGDSLGMVVQGYDTTLAVTVDQMVYHTQMVARGRRRALVVADMPFLSYQASEADAVRNAGRLLKEGNAEAVKLEGGAAIAATVTRLVSAGIPVMGHIGLTPQSVHQMGGFKVQARDPEGHQRALRDARAVEEAGAFAIVLEGIPAVLGGEISRALTIPTIGIGAGPECDGQVLVMHDLLGLTRGRPPRFAKAYGSLGEAATQAAASYIDEVRARRFPSASHSYD